MNVVNETAFSLNVLSERGADGNLVLVVKGSYELAPDAPAQLVDDAPEFSGDVFYQDDVGRSLAWPTDLETYKPNFDFLIIGSFFAPEGKPVPHSRVGFQFGPLQKVLRIVGPRTAEVDAEGHWRVSQPTPIAELQLRWEHSAGGLYDLRNPFGMGQDALPRPDGREGAYYTLPMIEAVDDPPWTPERSVMPANLVPEPLMFSSRQKKLGTRDRRWSLFRAPLPPVDFDPSSANVAPEGQQAAGEPRGDEVLRFINLHPKYSDFSVSLPQELPFVAVAIQGSDVAKPVMLRLDTIITQPDAEKLTLLWRAPLPDIANEADIQLLVCEKWPRAGSRQQMADEVMLRFNHERAERAKADKLEFDLHQQRKAENEARRERMTAERMEAEEKNDREDIDAILKELDVPEELKENIRNFEDIDKAFDPCIEHIKKLVADFEHEYADLLKEAGYNK